jgi:hypothetical protein
VFHSPPRPSRVAVALFTLGALFVDFAAASERPTAGVPKSPPTESFSFASCVDAWRRREHSTKYLRFSWSQSETMFKGMLPFEVRMRARLEAGRGADVAEMPRTDTVLTGTFRVVFSGGDIRYEEDADAFSAQRNEPYTVHDIRILANERYVSRFDSHGDVHAIGEVQPPERNAVVRERNIVPLVLFFRILDSQYGQFAVDHVQVEPNSIVIDGHRCRVLRRSLRPGLAAELCVDAERDYIPLRYTFYEEGHVATQWSITKVSSLTAGLLAPSQWTMSRFRGDGRRISRLRAIATKCEVPTEVPRSEFELEFLPGIWVFDNLAHRQ